jgi:hypothetical protein
VPFGAKMEAIRGKECTVSTTGWLKYINFKNKNKFYGITPTFTMTVFVKKINIFLIFL